MMTILRRSTALLLAVAYAMSGVGAIVHLEHHHHHGPVVLFDAGNDPHVHRGCSCHHHVHPHADESCETHSHDHNCPHDHGDGDCPVCQTLAQKPAPIAVAVIVSAPQLLFDRPEDPAVTPEQPGPALPLSRGPPALV